MDRLSEQQVRDLESQYLNDELESALYAAFMQPVLINARANNDLLPAEVWSEAKAYLSHLSSIKKKNYAVQNIRKELEIRYSIFDNGIERIARSESQKQRTASIVMMAIFFQLLCAHISSLEGNPYVDLIRAIFDNMKTDPFILSLYSQIDTIETQNEKQGDFVRQKDYILGESTAQLLQDQNIADRDKRIAILKQSYQKFQEQIPDKFTGGSQWFYVYKLMSELSYYEEHRYQEFYDDLVKAGVLERHLPNTTQFTRKYKDIKEYTMFPNWKHRIGGRNDILTMGIDLARIVFNIINGIK